MVDVEIEQVHNGLADTMTMLSYLDRKKRFNPEDKADMISLLDGFDKYGRRLRSYYTKKRSL